LSSQPVDLEVLYTLLKWPSSPGSPEALERFKRITEFAFQALSDPDIRGLLGGKSEIAVLDVMAASGIAGVAFAKAASSLGYRVKLAVLDVRGSELRLAPEWLRVAGLEGVAELELVEGDATRLPEVLGGRVYDLVVCWGSSLPHLDVYDLILLLAGIREIQRENGVLVVEQFDLLPRILVGNAFEKVRVEGDLLTVFKEYDAWRGVQRRLVYKLPSLEYLGVVESRLWDVAQIAALTWLFYVNIKTYDFQDLKRTSKVIIAYPPRRTAPRWRELVPPPKEVGYRRL